MKLKLKNNQGIDLHVELIKNSSNKVYILFHGMFGNSSQLHMIKTKQYLIKKKYSVITFDYSAHGKSKGIFTKQSLSTFLHDKDLVLNYAMKYFKEIYFFGVSFGAHLALLDASTNKKVKGIILFNPATNMINLALRKKTHKIYSNQTKKRNVGIFTKFKFVLEYLKHRIYNSCKSITCPVYVYHILNDPSVPVSQSKKLEYYIKSKKKFIFEKGSDHNLSKEMTNGIYLKKLLPDAINWIEKNKK
ncbi:alpha/beta fold hydrolase [archaeon]|jgi:uncharacterized protein|nr:alpha/beta fold hydrolase [archaeon]MBT4272939.1 alpha/beta fold hydrolase [archaeon]MBT4460682.1 alpha/beta fold hydrolase [archaeon]MBT4857971.1 alpha/beta fold hydrolase [archaeon]MBT6773635.1 alpha/beta fold hydrolase [archaeon]